MMRGEVMIMRFNLKSQQALAVNALLFACQFSGRSLPANLASRQLAATSASQGSEAARVQSASRSFDLVVANSCSDIWVTPSRTHDLPLKALESQGLLNAWPQIRQVCLL